MVRPCWCGGDPFGNRGWPHSSVEQRPNYIPLIHIQFRSEAPTFNPQSFRNGKTSLLIDSLLAEQVAAWVEAKAQVAEKEQELARARNQVFEMFRTLTAKYNVPEEHLWENGAISPLGAILERLEGSQQPETWELEWLEAHGLHRLLATIHYRDYRRSGDAWILVKACKYLRKAGLPEKVISVSSDIPALHSLNKRALSALWTTRGGAFRDLNDLAAAKKSAADAIRESSTSFHPHNLMGAVLYEDGCPAEGDKHFAEAERLGSAPRDQESEIRRALDRSAPEARRKVVEYLLSKDPKKYSWVRRFGE